MHLVLYLSLLGPQVSAQFTFLSLSGLPFTLFLSLKGFTSFMDWPLKILFAAFLLAAAAIHGAQGDAMVTGTVFCDQCKDGQISLFDYPLRGDQIYLSIFFT